jgi:hypothetical protein
MRSTFLKIIALALLLGAIWFAVLWFIRAPIASEFWLRELMIVKRSQVQKLSSPQIIVVGGSSVWFGVDATLMKHELGRACYNYGLHAALRPEWILDEVRKVVRPGDFLVLMLEDSFYKKTSDWDTWALRTAIAWNPDWIDRLTFGEKAKAILKGGTLDMALEILQTKALQAMHSPIIIKREKSLDGENAVLKRFSEEQGNYDGIVYAQSNIDDRGDVLHNEGCRYTGQGFGSAEQEEGFISSHMKVLLSKFLGDMKAEGVKVVVAHAPSHLKDPANPHWVVVDENLKCDLGLLGVELIDYREDVIFSKESFYDTPYHLNTKAREQRTRRLIDAIKANGLGK